MENNIDDLVSGVEIYVEKKIGDAPFDKTLNGIIKGINSENHYSVLINGRVYDNIESDETCVINESVKILVPQNNYNKMFILKNNNGGKSSDVTSVNGKVGDVILNANDVEALPNTTVIPNKTSQLTNDSNYVSDVNYIHTDNNFTTTEKNKLSNIESNAQVNTVNSVDGEQGDIELNDVKYTTQTLTDNQKTQARTNIGAGTSSFSGDYSDLSNKPTIPTVNNATLTIQKNGTTIKSFTSNSSTDTIANISVPTKTSELTNNSDYATTTIVDSKLSTHNTNANAHVNLFSSKLDKTQANPFIQSVSYDSESGVITFTSYNNTTTTIDLPVENIVESGYYDSETQEIILVLVSGDEIKIPASGLIDDYNGGTTNTIQVVVSNDNVITANLISGSVTKTLLSQELQTTIDELVTDKHTHSNKSVLDNTTASYTTVDKNKLDGIESNAQVNTVTGVKGNSETNYRVGNINITQDNIGLGNVENVSTNNQTPTWTISSTLSNLTSGEKLSVAFGKIAKAISSLISHIGNVANPHNVTKSQVGLENVDNTKDVDKNVNSATNDGSGNVITNTYATKTEVAEHLSNTNNPHNVTKEQVNLGNVDNTSDADKPLSTVAQSKFDEIDEDMKYQQNVTTNNMLKVTLPTTTLNGITCTNNGDGTYTLNGTATARFNVVVGSMSFTEGNYYRLVGFPIQGVQDNFGLYVSGLFKFDKGDGITFVSQSSGSYTVRIQVSTGYSCENIIIKPMLTTNLDATYDDFVRYTGTQGRLNADFSYMLASIGTSAYTNYTTTISSGNNNLPTSGAVYNALSGKEDSFTKNTAFNKNFGTTSDTVCQGNDSRLSDSRNAKDVYAWAKESTKPTYTKSEVGLSNVPNVVTNDQTPTYTEATTRSNLISGEKLSVVFGKIMKWFSDLKSVAFSGSYNDLSDTPTIPTVGNGTITFTQNGTSKGTITTNQSGNTTIALTDNNTTYGVATSSTLGLVKSGTDITVDTSGNVSVNDDSHNHVISNVDGLQSSLDSKYSSSNPQISVSGSSGSCTGNSATATTATKLSNTSAIGSSSQPVYFNSSGVPVVVDNCTPKSHASSDTTYGVSSSSNYGHAMASSATPLVAGTASVGTDNGKFAREGHVHPQQESVRLLNNLYTARPTDADVIPTGSGGISTFQATSSMTNNKPPIGDAHVIHMFWDNTNGWDSQLAVSNSSSRNGVQYRCMNNRTWGNWDTLLSLGNNVTSTISSGNTSLPTSDAVYNYVKTATNYEEGTWTPTLMPSSASQSTVSTIVAQGIYRKIGKMVYIKGYLATSSAYSCANISGIPYSIGMPDVTSLPSQSTSSLTISRTDTNEINKCSLSQYCIKNLGYSSSVTSTSWLIDGWYMAT